MSPRHAPYLLPALALAVLVFGQTLGFEFVNWDDDVNVLENRDVRFFDLAGVFTHTVIGNYNPLAHLTFALEYAAVGDDAWLYHFDNLWLHLVNVTLVFALGRRLRLGAPAAGLLACLFAVHPMRVESVAWVTERKDVLFAAFYFGALYVYEGRRARGRGAVHWSVLALFALALASKIQAVSLPLSMLCLDYLRSARPPRATWLYEKWPYFGMSLAVGLAGVYFLGENGSLEDATDYSALERLAVGAYAFVVYLAKAALPYEMSPLYPYPAQLPTQAYLSFIGVAACAGLAYWAHRTGRRAVTFALGFFAVNVVFMLQVLGAGQGYLADRFTYVGYFGLFWGVAYAAQGIGHFASRPTGREVTRGLRSRRRAVAVACALYLAGATVASLRQTRIWENGDALWSHVIDRYPDVATAYGNRGQYLRDRGRLDEALALFTRAIAADPRKGTYYNSRGKLHFDAGRTDAAIADYTAGLAVDPDLGELHINRGAALAQSGRYDDAARDLERGIALDPDNFNGYLNRSLLLYTTGRAAEALRDYDEMLQLRPERHDLWHERGVIHASLGRVAEGNRDIEVAITLSRGSAEAARYAEDLR